MARWRVEHNDDMGRMGREISSHGESCILPSEPSKYLQVLTQRGGVSLARVEILNLFDVVKKTIQHWEHFLNTTRIDFPTARLSS